MARSTSFGEQKYEVFEILVNIENEKKKKNTHFWLFILKIHNVVGN